MSRESSLPIPLYNKQTNKQTSYRQKAQDIIPKPAIIVFFPACPHKYPKRQTASKSSS